MSTNSPNLSKAQRREAARAQALALKKKQEAADRRARVITMSVLGIVLIALIAVVAVLFIRDHRNNAANATDNNLTLSQLQPSQVPSTARADGGIVVGKNREAGGTELSGVPEVGIYFDYMCPICGQFEQVNKANLEAAIKGGTANVVMHPVSILDRASQGTQYSTRAAAASAWVAEKAPTTWLDFHEALYANEPTENTSGHTNAELATIAKNAGVPADVAAGISSGEARRTFAQWVTSATNAATGNAKLANPQSGGFGTPTITINGERWGGDWTDPSALPAAIKAATK
ncbi:MAG: thioredoxin domain-containing protein [Promicromonosporaceae bacterium]|nr:thioredoxin domain-containing protein [Promicromonosporaceae bacterium]